MKRAVPSAKLKYKSIFDSEEYREGKLKKNSSFIENWKDTEILYLQAIGVIFLKTFKNK